MEAYLSSMALIALIAIFAPMIAQAIPKKPIPEIVFLLFAGAILGPHTLQLIEVSEPISLFSELGLAFLFLLAGYEINPNDLKSDRGKAALGTWFVSFALAVGVVIFVPVFEVDSSKGMLPLVIAMTSTALGTLLPILKERGLMESSIGKTVLAHGTFGELMPILAMALLLSVRSTWESIAILVLFLVIAVATAVFPKRAEKFGAYFKNFLDKTADTTSQSTVRVTVALLVGLVTLAAFFKLDIVLGAFAAGFILRYSAPDQNKDLEEKLEGIAFGFFIPLFFVVSGANIDLSAVFEKPLVLVAFVLALLLVRAVPAYLATFIPKEDREEMSHRDRLTAALYSTTALPIIVAVTHVALSGDLMDESTASVLVCAGALTVLLMPILASLSSAVAEAHPVQAAQEIASSPSHAWEVLKDHWSMARKASLEQRALMLKLMQARNLKADQLRSKSPEELLQLKEDLSQDLYDESLNGISVDQLRQFIQKREMFLQTMKKRKRASFKGELSKVRDDSWPELKKRGDAQWEQIKEESMQVWEQLKEEGDKRWEQIKLVGDREWNKRQRKASSAQATEKSALNKGLKSNGKSDDKRDGKDDGKRDGHASLSSSAKRDHKSSADELREQIHLNRSDIIAPKREDIEEELREDQEKRQGKR